MAALHLVSRYPRPDCVRRLKEVVTSWWGGTPGTPCGRVRESGATLRMSICYRNSFQTVLRLKMSDRPDGGTDLTCRFGINRFVLGFMVFWFGSAAGLDLIIAIKALFSGESVDFEMLLSVVPFLAAGAALVGFCRFLARNERTQLLLFLEDTIDARLPG